MQADLSTIFGGDDERLGRVLILRVVVEKWREPTFRSRDFPSLAPGIVNDLVALDLANGSTAQSGCRLAFVVYTGHHLFLVNSEFSDSSVDMHNIHKT